MRANILTNGGCIARLLLSYLACSLLFLVAEAYAPLSDQVLKKLPRPGNDFDIHSGEILAPILVPRVSGTEANAKVRDHLASFIKKNMPSWRVEFQNSTSKTPVTGDKLVPFVNIIATRDPPWLQAGEVGRLTVAAHYDSKLTPKGFIGAIDSAAPCAMLLHAMRSIDAALTRKWDEMQKDSANELPFDEPGIQILLLDGEEAFARWTATDSLYGARSLAEHMEQQVYPAMSTYKTPLSSISLFVLLDLLGAKNPQIPNYFPTTEWAYDHFGILESRLRDLGQFKSAGKKKSAKRQWFPNPSNFAHGFVEDDHIPFMERGVDVLHVIPTPFPSVWHTLDDDGEHLDMPTVEDWSTLVTAFMAEWMELDGALQKELRAETTRKSEL
ncbi:hypothetical protein KEM55_007814 [Ascosphaera atra]|nr:hypothetical protein KEM55_007814 [Ascosphaera atra]